MRVFLALDIPDAIRRGIADFAQALRPHAPRARWARVEGAHVTLKFIGETPSDRLDAVRQAIEPVRASGPIPIDFRGIGFFPNDRRPRVLWVGVHAPPVLAELAAEIEKRLVPLGIPAESRPFAPHLTLARFDRTSESVDLRQMLDQSPLTEFGSTVAREFHLYESKLGRGGAIYTRLETVVFAQESA